MIKTTIVLATTSVAGISRRATDVNAIAGVSTDETLTPSNLTAKIDTDGALTGNLDTRIASQKATKTYADLKLAKASNLTDLASPATAFANIKQLATTSATGVVELAIDAEAISGVSTAVVVTPANLTARLSNPGAIGNSTAATSIATQALKVTTGAGDGKQLRSDALGNLSFFSAGTMVYRDLTISAVDPTSGDGADGDIWFTYA